MCNNNSDYRDHVETTNMMTSILVSIAFLLVWIYALHQSIAYSGIVQKGVLGEVSIHWSQVLFWFGIGTILSGSVFVFLTDNLRYLILCGFGVLLECALATWIFFEMNWDERGMLFKEGRHTYLKLPRTDASVLALEQTCAGKLGRSSISTSRPSRNSKLAPRRSSGMSWTVSTSWAD